MIRAPFFCFLFFFFFFFSGRPFSPTRPGGGPRWVAALWDPIGGLQARPSLQDGRPGPWLGGARRRPPLSSGQLVAYSDLEFCTQNFLVTLPQIFLYGKKFYGFVCKTAFPIQNGVRTGVKTPPWGLLWKLLSRIGRWIYKRGPLWRCSGA